MQPVDYLPSWLAEILFWIFYNQTLIAGTVAASAALVTVLYLQKQISQTEGHRRDDLRRRHRMLRAGLPSALAELTHYAEECGRAIFDIRHSSGTPSVCLPHLPVDALRNIQNVVETADEVVASDIEKLIRFYQVQTSRLETLATCKLPARNITANRFCDAVFLKAATVRLFSYSRGEVTEASEWYDAVWATYQIASMALPGGSGSLPIDTELEEHLSKSWAIYIRKYG